MYLPTFRIVINISPEKQPLLSSKCHQEWANVVFISYTFSFPTAIELLFWEKICILGVLFHHDAIHVKSASKIQQYGWL